MMENEGIIIELIGLCWYVCLYVKYNNRCSSVTLSKLSVSKTASTVRPCYIVDVRKQKVVKFATPLNTFHLYYHILIFFFVKNLVF